MLWMGSRLTGTSTRSALRWAGRKREPGIPRSEVIGMSSRYSSGWKTPTCDWFRICALPFGFFRKRDRGKLATKGTKKFVCLLWLISPSKSFASVVSLVAEERRMETNTSVGQDARAICAECGKGFSVNDMIRYGASYVCATCKPIFMQKLAEGASISSGRMRYAGFWLRFGAVVLDAIVLFIVSLMLRLVLGLPAVQTINNVPSGLALV